MSVVLAEDIARDKDDHRSLGLLLAAWALEHRPDLVKEAEAKAFHLMMPGDGIYLDEVTAQWFLDRIRLSDYGKRKDS